MRVFIGIKASETLQKNVVRWRLCHRDLPVRWIKARNLHLTLVPPGPEEEVRKTFEDIQHLTIQPFSMLFDCILVYAKYHVICLESSQSPDILSEIAKRKFSPHFTIARFKRKIEMPLYKVKWKEAVTAITLFESRLSPKEANYYAIQNKMVG
jgi:2'-5' RNA ligase